MNKLEERKIFDMVYKVPGHLDVIDYEAPDFIVSGSGLKIGVEVTELYLHSVDAKLQKLDGYIDGLLDGTQLVHRRDRNHIKVDEIELQDRDGNCKGKPTAIITELPPLKERFRQLTESIKDKEKKLSSYKESADVIDLVILDASSVFFHEKFENFFKSLLVYCDIDIIKKSCFREIIVISKNLENKQVYIPLRAALFLSDCFAYESFLADEYSEEDPDRELLNLLLASLQLSGYKNLKVSEGKEETSILYGAWELNYTENGKNFRDRLLFPHMQESLHLEEISSSFSAEIISKAKVFLERREDVYSSVPISFPVHTE